jgi:hypothetical protein
MDLLTRETIIKWGPDCGIVRRAMMCAACHPSDLPPVSNGPAEAIDPAQDFTQLVRWRQPAPLDPWLKRATTSTQEALQRLAQGLYEGYDAVNAGITLPWSTGPVEGHGRSVGVIVRRHRLGRPDLPRCRAHEEGQTPG